MFYVISLYVYIRQINTLSNEIEDNRKLTIYIENNTDTFETMVWRKPIRTK